VAWRSEAGDRCAWASPESKVSRSPDLITRRSAKQRGDRYRELKGGGGDTGVRRVRLDADHVDFDRFSSCRATVVDKLLARSLCWINLFSYFKVS